MSVRKVVLVPFEQYQTLIGKSSELSTKDNSNLISKDDVIRISGDNNNSPENNFRKAETKLDLLQDVPKNQKEESIGNETKLFPRIVLKKTKKRNSNKKKILKKVIKDNKLSFNLPPPSVGLQSGGSKLFNFKSPIEEKKDTDNKTVNKDLNNINNLISKYWID